MDELDSVSVAADQLVATVRNWWDGTRSGGQLREQREAAVAESWHAFRGALESETQASVWLPLAAPGPAWQVRAPSLANAEHIRVHLDVAVEDSDRQRIADVFGLGDSAGREFLDDAAALVGEYGWDVASCTEFALRIARIDARAWWAGGDTSGRWSMDVESLDLDPGTRIANADSMIARFARTVEDYVASERSRLMLDGQEGYWEAVMAAQALAEELAARINEIDADAWSRGSASPLRAALMPVPTIATQSRAEPDADRVRLRISADALVAFVGDEVQGVDSIDTSNSPAVVEWLRGYAWRPPSGPDLPTHHVNVTFEPASGDGIHKAER
jgi:hypothetical protein